MWLVLAVEMDLIISKCSIIIRKCQDQIFNKSNCSFIITKYHTYWYLLTKFGALYSTATLDLITTSFFLSMPNNINAPYKRAMKITLRVNSVEIFAHHMYDHDERIVCCFEELNQVSQNAVDSFHVTNTACMYKLTAVAL